MSSWEKIRVEPLLDGAVAHVVLDAPKANVLDAVMLGEINAFLDSCRDRPELKLLAFSGAGSHFSCGASVAEHVREQAPAMLENFHGMFLRLVDLAIPTAAAVSGRCLGGGMELACFCNWVYASPTAVFAQPEIQLAVFPPVASIILPFKVGQSAADAINLTGRNVAAEEAKAMGLIDRIVDDPLTELMAFSERELAPKSASSLRFAVRASRWRMNAALRTGLPQLERLYVDELMATHDANEGIAAFLEKRKAAFDH